MPMAMEELETIERHRSEQAAEDEARSNAEWRARLARKAELKGQLGPRAIEFLSQHRGTAYTLREMGQALGAGKEDELKALRDALLRLKMENRLSMHWMEASSEDCNLEDLRTEAGLQPEFLRDTWTSVYYYAIR